jgi:hypothetical protein
LRRRGRHFLLGKLVLIEAGLAALLWVRVVLLSCASFGRVIVRCSLSTIFPAITSVLVVARLVIIEARLALVPSLGTRSLVPARVVTVALAPLLFTVLVTLIAGLLLAIAPLALPLAVSSLEVLRLATI